MSDREHDPAIQTVACPSGHLMTWDQTGPEIQTCEHCGCRVRIDHDGKGVDTSLLLAFDRA